ncbi:ER lumen protein retaining receptor [Parasponia andersonii]|uniref:ER lumen protein-retaining receptor n=1 Tax=Parasponia andersonii TaxID=3476 RepID=A0A2P5DC26_PARAD|nr:ER lumen protein retaining receptor [Parasponia andersonii]
MNIFRFAGDMTHLASVLVLLLKIHTIKSCAGVSLKTQELYAIVFATRYLDIFTAFVSLYNTIMKLIFLGSSFSIVWYMRSHKIVRRSYDKEQDTFRHYLLIVPCLVFAIFINEKFTFKEVMWTFSLYLEAVAILPQLVLLQRTRNIDNLTGQYVFLLGAYRAFYIVNWIYRYFTEPHYVHWILIAIRLAYEISSLTDFITVGLTWSLVLYNAETVTNNCSRLISILDTMIVQIQFQLWFGRLSVSLTISLLMFVDLWCLQLGFRGFFKHCCMEISSIIISTGEWVHVVMKLVFDNGV